MKFDSTYFENRDCEYYPCHEREHINCLFCYCPLYFLACPGDYLMIDVPGKSGTIKDCSQCTVTHDPDKGWEIVQKALRNPVLRDG
jgi:Zn-finger protein